VSAGHRAAQQAELLPTAMTRVEMMVPVALTRS
jgi:hypothetical protein